MSQSENYSNAPPSTNATAFYQQFLPVVTQKTGSLGAIAWDCSTVPYKVIGQYVGNGQTIQLGLSEQDHLNLLKRTQEGIETGSPAVLFAETDKEGPKQTVAMMPINRGNESDVVEIIFADTIGEKRREQIASAISSFSKAAFEMQQNAQHRSGGALQDQTGANVGVVAMDSFVKRVHRSLDLKTTAFEIANELQTMSDCDRVAVLQKKGDRLKAVAFSGQSELAARSNTIRALEVFAETQLANGQSFWHPAESIEDDSVQSAFDSYRVHSDFKQLAVLPLFDKPEPTPSAEGDSAEGSTETELQRNVIGSVVLENFGDRSFLDKQTGIELLVTHAESAFRNAHTHQDLPFFRITNWLGKLTSFRLSKSRNRWLIFGAVLLLALLALVFVKTEFKVVADGVLLPAERRNIYSEVTGEISKLYVEHGTDVEKGEPLVEISSDELQAYLEDLKGKINSTRRQIEAIDQAKMKADQRGADASQTSMLNIEREKLNETLKALDREVEIAQKREAKLNIMSPIKGRILSWKIDHELSSDRPVTRGQRLLEIAKLDGPWIVEVNLPDKDVGKVLAAKADTQGPLPVTFILASDPGRSLQGELIEIAEATHTDPQAGQAVRLRVKIKNNDLDFRQVRTDVRARIHCGKRSLGYVWMHDFFEFVQSKILFNIF